MCNFRLTPASISSGADWQAIPPRRVAGYADPSMRTKIVAEAASANEEPRRAGLDRGRSEPFGRELFGCTSRSCGSRRSRSNSVMRWTLLAASAMIGNQRLHHFSKSRGKSYCPDALGRDSGTLAYQEDFIGEALRISQLGFAADANEPFAHRSFMLADDPPRRMIHVW